MRYKIKLPQTLIPKILKATTTSQEKTLAEIHLAARQADVRPDEDLTLLGKRRPYGFVPTVDGAVSAHPVVPENPAATLLKGEEGVGGLLIPVMAGVTKDDGGFFPIALWDKLDRLFGANFSTVYGPLWVFGSRGGSSSCSSSHAKESRLKLELLKEFYLGGRRERLDLDDPEVVQGVFDFFGDLAVNFPTYKALQLHSKYDGNEEEKR